MTVANEDENAITVFYAIFITILLSGMIVK